MARSAVAATRLGRACGTPGGEAANEVRDFSQPRLPRHAGAGDCGPEAVGAVHDDRAVGVRACRGDPEAGTGECPRGSTRCCCASVGVRTSITVGGVGQAKGCSASVLDAKPLDLIELLLSLLQPPGSRRPGASGDGALEPVSPEPRVAASASLPRFGHQHHPPLAGPESSRMRSRTSRRSRCSTPPAQYGRPRTVPGSRASSTCELSLSRLACGRAQQRFQLMFERLLERFSLARVRRTAS